jgi:hypothetical protein
MHRRIQTAKLGGYVALSEKDSYVFYPLMIQLMLCMLIIWHVQIEDI